MSARVRAWRRRLSVVVVVLSRATHDVCARTRAHSVAAFTVAVMARGDFVRKYVGIVYVC